jgi:hypothetical protein
MSADIRSKLAKPARFPGLVSDPGEDVDRNAARVLSAIALASVAAGAINIAAAATIGLGSTQNLAFFVVLGAAQLYWGAVAVVRVRQLRFEAASGQFTMTAYLTPRNPWGPG